MQEMDLYFSKHLDKLVQTALIDVSNTNLNEANGRSFLIDEYNTLRHRLYIVLGSVYSRVNIDNLDSVSRETYDLFVQEVQAHSEAAEVEISDTRLEIETLRFVLDSIIYDLRVLFKGFRTTDEVVAIFINQFDEIIANSGLNEEGRNQLRALRDQQAAELRTLTESQSNRQGHVLVDYTDESWYQEGDVWRNSIRDSMVIPALSRFAGLFDYFFKKQIQRDLLSQDIPLE
jgi:hypothetical protein